MKTECIVKSLKEDVTGSLLVIGVICALAVIVLFLSYFKDIGINIATVAASAQGFYVIMMLVVGIGAIWVMGEEENSGKLIHIATPLVVLYLFVGMFYLCYILPPASALYTNTPYPDMFGWTIVYFVIMTILIIAGRVYIRCKVTK